MIIRELIEKLQEFDPDLPVIVKDNEDGWTIANALYLTTTENYSEGRDPVTGRWRDIDVVAIV